MSYPAPLSVAASLLIQVRGMSAGYSSGVNDGDLRHAHVGLLSSLVTSGELDMKVAVADEIKGLSLPLPAAWATISNPYEEIVSVMADLDPECLAVETEEGPSFAIAVRSAIARVGKGYQGNATNESDALAVWCRNVPQSHCLAFDKPGDQPCAGLFKALRKSGHYESLENELIKKGFDQDGVDGAGFPVAVHLYMASQWNSWIEAGGNPFAKVPAVEGRKEMEVWEFLAFARPGALLSSIQEWSEGLSVKPPGFEERLADLTFWHGIDTLATRSGTRDDLVNGLKEIKGWEDRRDDLGRGVLQRVIGAHPAFLTTCIKTAKWRPQLQVVDNFGRGIWYYVVPMLMGHNHRTNAVSMKKELSSVVPFTLENLDNKNGSGLVTRLMIDIHQGGGGVTQDRNASAREMDFPLDILLGGKPEQQDEAAVALVRLIDNAEGVVPASGPLSWTNKLIAPSLDQKNGHQNYRIQGKLTPQWRGALALSLLYPTATSSYQATPGSKSSLPSAAATTIARWISEGVEIPRGSGIASAERIADLQSKWATGKIAFSDTTNGTEIIVEALKHWRALEETMSLDSATPEAINQSASRSLRL